MKKMHKVAVRKNRNAYVARWQDAGKIFEVYFRKTPPEIMQAQLRLALAGAGEFPAEIADKPAVRKWLGDVPDDQDKEDDDALIARYAAALPVDIKRQKRTGVVLRNFRAFVGRPLSAATYEDAENYLAKRMSERATNTRNLEYVILCKFYKWYVRAGKIGKNPFADMKQIKVVRRQTDIHYLTREERDEVLQATEKTRYPLSVWLALYAGLRENEVWLLRWEAVNLDTETLVAQSKRGHMRTVPIAPPLLEKLKAAAPAKMSGPVFPVSMAAAPRKLVKRLQGLCPHIDKRCIGWNPFRHTFASLLAQAGVSIDKICSLMGNTPDVCREHYARFVPRTARDNVVDVL